MLPIAPTIPSLFPLYATFLISLAFMFWARDGIANTVIRFMFVLGMLWGVFETAHAFGFIVKV